MRADEFGIKLVAQAVGGVARTTPPMTHRALTPNLIPLTRASRPAPQASSEIRAPLRPQAPAPSAALTDLYRTHRAELVRFARIRIRHASDAEDLVQDAFLAAARAYPDREAKELKPLLFTMVRNLSINYLKSGHTRRARLSEPVEDQASRLACEATPSPEALLATRQQLALIEAALAGLPERRREALRLHRIERLSHKQIAARLGVSPSTVKSDIVMAVAEMTETLARAERAGGVSC